MAKCAAQLLCGPKLVLSLFAVPPTIVDHRSSADLVVREKERVNLTCQARGYPEPQILWRREDGGPVLASGQLGPVSGEFILWKQEKEVRQR